VVQRWILTDYAQLGLMRASLRQATETQALLPGAELDDLAERLAMVATELATNALRHGQSQAVVGLNRSATAFMVDVADDLPAVPPQVLEGDRLGTGGRGLRITQQLARDTGWYVAGGRKHVWARFPIPRRIRRLQAPPISVPGFRSFLRGLRRRIR
jgi:anti-sigma regulatory factor (Ser/Thr protein kinase)